MRLDLNTNMELVGLREPYKATYKVTKNPRKNQSWIWSESGGFQVTISIFFSSLICLLSTSYPETIWKTV